MPDSWKNIKNKEFSIKLIDRLLYRKLNKNVLKKQKDKEFPNFARRCNKEINRQVGGVVLFVKRNDEILECGRKLTLSESQLYMVFYRSIAAEAKGKYALLQGGAMKKLITASKKGTLTVRAHDKMVDMLKSKSRSPRFATFVLDIREYLRQKRNVRICLVNTADYNRLISIPEIIEKKPDSILLLENFKGGNEDLPAGVVVSSWECLNYQLEIQTTDLELISKAHPGVGNGHRSKMKYIGTNIYEGCRLSDNVARINGMYGPGEVGLQRYQSQRHNNAYMTKCEAFSNKLSTVVNDLAKKLDSTICRILETFCETNSITGLCGLKIITYGKFGEKYCFCNTQHLDDGDCITDVKLTQKIKKEYKRYLKEPMKSQTRKCAEYLKKWSEQIGHFCLPTTCAYVQVGNPEGDVYQTFSLNGLGVTVRFDTNTVHMMYAGVFSHQTPACSVIRNGKVFYGHKNSDFQCFAWGNGGLKK
jgi:hypothetical protein